MPMRVVPTAIPDVLLIEVDAFRDDRGVFYELHRQPHYSAVGISDRFVQDNFSRSTHGVLRGLHYQLEHPQAKLVTVLSGRVFDVAVDVRRSSPTFGQWVGCELSGDRPQQLYIPPGFAHGFCVLSESADFLYKCSDIYAPSGERGIIWNDPSLAISWPIEDPHLSAKDRAFRTLGDMGADLPR
ncbi:dTDP-4-dehydrorhamnose 3,5-epimerase [Nitrospira sp.]|nr:dTDP-4-dehydrorhamnose 3,5-epimerase [Nitrospira sp.]